MSVVKFERPKPRITLRPVAFPECCMSCEHHEGTQDGDDYCLENLIVLDDLFSICDNHQKLSGEL